MNTTQHKTVNLLKTFFFAHQFLLVFVYLMHGPRQFFFCLCGPETPKGGTSLNVVSSFCSESPTQDRLSLVP